jgi:ethanolamine utilization protein EutN
MMLARVEGSITATRKHPSLRGWRLLICQPVNHRGENVGSPVVAIDAHGAGLHQQVVVSTDGRAARRAVKDQKSPVRMMIIAVADEVHGG